MLKKISSLQGRRKKQQQVKNTRKKENGKNTLRTAKRLKRVIALQRHTRLTIPVALFSS